jgi:hypothetical protein
MNSNLRYEHLKRITETQKPYRGTINKYPFSDRHHNYKYFYPREVNGEIEYHVGYYHKWESETMTAEEFNAKKSSMAKGERKKWREETIWKKDSSGIERTGNFIKDFKNPKVDLIIRSDNTVEIVTDSFHQGMRMIFSAWNYANGVFQSSVEHGGIVYGRRDNGVDIRIPIFKHIRFNMDTMAIHESSKYIATYKTVDRKKSKEAEKKRLETAKKNNTLRRSEETRVKMRKPKAKIECPHCKFVGGVSTTKRWHFDNCKLIKIAKNK